jgi:hypothetical protein
MNDILRLKMEGVPIRQYAGLPWQIAERLKFRCGGGGSTAPASEHVGQQYTALLDALVQGMPQVLQTAKTYDPQFTEAGLADTGMELTGTGTTPGLLSLYQNQVAPVMTATQTTANTALRTGNLADVNNLGAPGVAAIKGLDPGTAGLSDALTKTATSQLNAGTALDPDTLNRIMNTTLGAYSNRGLGTSPAAQLATSTNMAAGGQNLLAQREQTAGNVINQNMQNYTDPVLAMLGINSNVPSTAASMTGTGSSLASNATAGTSINMNDLTSLLGTTYNATAASNIANANNSAALCGTEIGAGSSLAGAGMLTGAILA